LADLAVEADPGAGVTRLFDLLAQRIRRQGPLSVAEFMEEALGHPELGYYRTRDPLGRQGDFITAPEVSQIFGELIGLWCADAWESCGRPDPVLLVELGPGRGTLMADALRALKVAPAFRAAARLHLVETSPVLREAQARRLGEAEPIWHETIETLPKAPMIAVANEFFDALPVHQLCRTAEGWRERLVDLDASGDRLSFVVAHGATRAAPPVPQRLAVAPEGSVFEVSPLAMAVARELGRHATEHGGAVLVVDYGYVAGEIGDTLQAVRGHAPHDVLAEPGTADLTAHVDFAGLAAAAREGGARCHGPATQGDFLRALGIGPRLEALLAQATPDQASLLRSGCRRLIDPEEMGRLFKVLAIADPRIEGLAGLPIAPLQPARMPP
jgi:NADH dehydrogenase [ubiquinone] 1 alpha subcomplex assembly factor 7